MSITLIAVLIMLVFVGIAGIIKVDPKYQFILGENFGSNPSKLLLPGLHWAFFPYSQVLAKIKMDRLQLNIPNFHAVCSMDQNQFSESLQTSYSGLAEINFPNISVNYELNFVDETAPALNNPSEKNLNREKFFNYNRYLETTADAKADLSELNEEILDIVKSMLIGIISNGYLHETLKSEFFIYDENSGDYTKITLNNLAREINAELEANNIPAKITSLKIDSAPIIVDKTLADAWNNISQGAILDQAQKLQLARNLAAAEKEVEIAKKQVEKQMISLERLRDFYKVGQLPDAEQARFWLNREALDVYRDMLRNSKSTIVVGGDIMAQINQMLSLIGK